MRVLLTHSSAEMYGSDRMAAEAVAALVDKGHDVVVVLPSEGLLGAWLRSVGAQVHCLKIPVLRKSNLRPAGLLALTAGLGRTLPVMWQTIRQLRPDLVYINTVTQPWWLALARIRGLPTLVHVREAEPQLPRMLRSALMLPLLMSDLVVCNSRSTQDSVTQAVPVRPERLRVIYNGKNWDRYQLGAGPAPFPSAEEVLTMVVVGRLSPRKGQDVAIRALAELVLLGLDARLRLVGDVFPGYEWFEQELKDLARSLGVADRVAFVGFLEDVSHELAGASVSLVPSRIEPFGTVAAESMAAGVLTMVAEVQGLTEIVTDYRTGLTFPTGDAAVLALRCVWAVRNPQEVERIRKAGREFVLNRLTREQYRAQIVEAVESVVAVREMVEA